VYFNVNKVFNPQAELLRGNCLYRTYRRFLPRVALAAVLIGSAVPYAGAAATHDLSAMLGRWQINPLKTHMGRAGPNGNNLVRSSTFTFVFGPAPHGLLINVYEKYPQPAPSRTMEIVPDEKQHRCVSKEACQTVGGDAEQQSYAYHQVNAHLLVRLFYVKGQISEYTTYAVSADGETFTMISWSPETPYYQNIQVFDKQP
jgi:hypothetical protein